MKKIEYIAIGGEFGFVNPLLIGRRILSVMRDGVGMSKIVTTTPQDKQAQYLISTGGIYFKSSLSENEDVIVLYADSDNVCFPVAIQSGYFMPVGVVGFAYLSSFYVNGTSPFTLIPDVKPSWMTITLSSNLITFSGTPAIGDAGNNTVSFTINNACGTANFSQVFNISAPTAQFDTTTFVSGDRSTDVEIANLTGMPGLIVTVTLEILTNVNGGVLKVNGAVASLNDTYNVTIGSNGKGSLNVEIDGNADNHGTAILGQFQITSVNAGEIGVSKTYLISKVF